MTVKKLTDLTGLKETQVTELAGMGINSVPDLTAALENETKVKEIIKTLSGVGPKTVMKWKSQLEGEETERKPVKDIESTKAKEAHKKAGKEIKQEEADKKEADKKAKKVAKAEAKAHKKADKDAAKADKKAKKEGEEEGKVEVVEDENAYVPSIKPVLDAVTTDALAKRAVISGRRPAFKRQEWFRYSKLGEGWRRPKGIHSKMKRNLKRRPPVVDIGFRGPIVARALHPSGFEEVLVYNVENLEAIDPKTQAVRIGGTVGTRKRILIQERAEELSIRVLNRMV
ncbi:MAG: 50S ribosomal protein L32e [Candidatus Methanomethylophilaceae archaeon]|jgi:large subunit ribosomal protein L32e